MQLLLLIINHLITLFEKPYISTTTIFKYLLVLMEIYFSH